MKRVAYFFLVFFYITPLTSFAQQTDYTITNFQEINELKAATSSTKKITTQSLSRLKTTCDALHKNLDLELQRTRSGDFTDNIQEQSSKYIQTLWDMELQLLDFIFEDEEEIKIAQTIFTTIRKAEIKYFKTFFAIVWSSSPVKSEITKQKIINSLGKN